MQQKSHSLSQWGYNGVGLCGRRVMGQTWPREFLKPSSFSLLRMPLRLRPSRQSSCTRPTVSGGCLQPLLPPPLGFLAAGWSEAVACAAACELAPRGHRAGAAVAFGGSRSKSSSLLHVRDGGMLREGRVLLSVRVGLPKRAFLF